MLGLQDVLTESHFLLPSAKGDESRISWLILSSQIVLYVTKYMVSVVRKNPCILCLLILNKRADHVVSVSLFHVLSFLHSYPWSRASVDSGQGKTINQYWPIRFYLLGFGILEQPLVNAPQLIVIWLFNQSYEVSQIFQTNFGFSLKSSIILTYCKQRSLVIAGDAQPWTLVQMRASHSFFPHKHLIISVL